MKNIFLKAISSVALTIVLILASQLPASGQNGKGRRIEGTWRIRTTLHNCQTGVELRSFSGLNTFLAGGSMIATGAPSSPALLSTGHGIWEYMGGRSFINTVVFFRFNPDGTYAGTQKVTRHIEIADTSDQFTTNDSVEFFDSNDNLISTGCVTGTGQRIE